MAGINPNLGKNLKLQQLQLNSTAKVDTKKAKGEEVGDAKPAAVWIFNFNGIGPVCNKGIDAKPGDVFITIEGDKVSYGRIIVDAQGNRSLLPISADDVQDCDYETDRGDIRSH